MSESANLKQSIDGKEYFPVPLELAIKFSEDFNFSFRIEITKGKFVKIHYDEQTSKANLEKYASKGLKSIYISEEDYKSFLGTVKSKVKELGNGRNEKENISNLASAFNQMKTSFVNYGVEQETMDFAGELVKAGLNVIAQTKSISALFKSFKDSNQEEFLKQVMKAYISSAVLDQFTWGKSNPIKEKMGLACLLVDVTLSSEDFKMLESSSTPSEKKERLVRHPLEIGTILRSTPGVEREVIEIIENHHEKPNGRGFPRGIDFGSIGKLPAVYIVVSDLVETAVKTEFDEGAKTLLLRDMKKSYSKGVFADIFDVLKKVIE